MCVINFSSLFTDTAFTPSADLHWLVSFWEFEVEGVLVAIPFAILITVLFSFDHNGEFQLLCTASHVLTDECISSYYEALSLPRADFLDFTSTTYRVSLWESAAYL